jgi:hypothetical protein
MRLVALGLAFAAACGDDGGAAVDATPPADAGPDDYRADRVGSIELLESSDSGWVYALVQDRPELPTPSAIAQDGDCTIFERPEPALCTPACTNGVCTATDTCTPWGVHRSAGTITVTGLRVPLQLVDGAYGYVPEPTPAGDLFDAGAAITVSAPGGETPAFSSSLVGVANLVAPFQNLTLVDGQDTEITWTADAGGTAEIQIALVVGWHGAPYEAMMLCETADDGSIVIPGGFIAQLPRQSSPLETHPSWIMRFDRDVVAGVGGPLEILVASRVGLYFQHP